LNSGKYVALHILLQLMVGVSIFIVFLTLYVGLKYNGIDNVWWWLALAASLTFLAIVVARLVVPAARKLEKLKKR
jgi:hypothetical protein